MKGKKRKHRRADQQVRTTPMPVSEERREEQSIWGDLLRGLIFIIFVLAVKIAVDHTMWGRQLNLTAYNLLQLQLSPSAMPVTLVDISDRPETISADGQNKATSRKWLREMLVALTEQHPKAIGVDIDFSKEYDAYIDPGDPDFFQFCIDLAKQRKVPIFLGIGRSTGQPAAQWLGEERFQDLAANILLPKDRHRMLKLIDVKDSEATVAGVNKPSKSMSFALAEAYSAGQNDSHGLRRFLLNGLQRLGFIEELRERELGPGIEVKDFLVDFSAIESIKPIKTVDPSFLRQGGLSDRLEGKIVMLGAPSAKDNFAAAGNQQLYPGYFLHACAAYTLVNMPLYEVTTIGRLGIDALSLLLVLLTIILLRLFYRNRTLERIATHRLQGYLTLLLVTVAFIVGVLLVRVTRIMWDDFFLALTFIVFHPSIERHLSNLWQNLKRLVPKAFHRLIFERAKE